MTAQVEVKLSGMRDAAVHCGTWRDIPTLAALKQAKHETWETIKKKRYSGQLNYTKIKSENKNIIHSKYFSVSDWLKLYA